MKVMFIQFSDIHFKESYNPIIEKENKLFNALQNKVLLVDKVILLVTGDSAFSGTIKEFDIAYNFINRLKQQIKTYSNVDIDTIVIPGNHDCNFTKQNKLRLAAINSISMLGSEGIDETIIESLTAPQKNYFTYANKLNPIDELIETNSLTDTYKFEINDKTIIINCFNSAYISQIHEKPGTMYLPVNYIESNILLERADLIISCFHHPINWLTPDNRREFKNFIEELSDVCFTGHEHQFTKSSVGDLENNVTYYIEGDVLQDSIDENNSGFNTVTFDLSDNKFLIENYRWKEDKYENSSNNTPWYSFDRNANSIKNPFAISKDYRLVLNDAGLNIRHPNISNVYLNNIYVFPRLDVINYFDSNKKDNINASEDSESLIKSLNSNIRIIFSGPENIGKTSLLKMTYVNLHSKGFIPVMIEGNLIKTTNINDLIQLLHKQYLNQYNTVTFSEFEQFDKRKIVILIDDFSRININKKYGNKLLSNLAARFDNMIIVNDETSILQDLISEGILTEELNFKIYQVKEFGHQLRGKLINKWIVLGVEEVITDEERIYKLNKAEEIIKSVVGKNFVPNYPLFILVLLQAIEAGNPTDLTASTFGHYYQYLIQRSFGTILKSQDEITSYNNYLSELAFHLFTRNTN